MTLLSPRLQHVPISLLLVIVSSWSYSAVDAFHQPSTLLVLSKRRYNTNNNKEQKHHQALLNPDILSQLDTLWTTFPYQAGALVCGVKASAADFIAQNGEMKEKDQIWSPSRNLSFLLYGSLYQGVCQEYIYNHLYPVWFGTSTTDYFAVFEKVALSLTFQALLLTLPTAYIMKATVMDESLSDGLRRYWTDLQENALLLKFWGIWGPTLTLTFTVIPTQYRVTFIAFISFFWLIILSGIVANEEKGETSS